ncbi:MAG: signal recognition particle protein [Erysipelotrichaceae bacterium]|nr:signal recognition particle protein [Erysipelotrichaceae bacterium]
MAFDSLSERLNKAMRDVAGNGTLTDANMEDMLKEVRLALLEADVNYRIVKQFLEEIREKARGEDVLNSVEPGQQLVKIVHDQIIELLGTDDAEIKFKESGITTIMMVGLQGTGKTTSAAKIAKIFKEKNERKVLMIAADVIRPAAIEQLQTLGNEIGVDVYTLGPDKSAKETVGRGMIYANENGYDTVIIDTAGRLHIDEELMDELRVINVNVEPDEILLTVDAMTGQDIVNVARAFAEALPLTGLVVTKFDGDSRGGGVLSVKKITGVPVKFVGEGEKLDDLSVFHPDRMADRILGMGDIVSLVERAQEKMDLEETEKMAERMLNGQFTMDDMLKQFDQISKLGPLSGIMKMLPGMNQYAGLLDEAKAGDAMKHTKAIIQSMTPYERAHPEKLRGTMKKRIARGSGTTVNDVNKLINQFSRVKKQIDQLGALNRSGSLNEESLEKMMNNVQSQMDDPRLQQQMKELQARNKKFRF